MKSMMIVMMLLALVSLIFLVQGVAMHVQVNTEEARFHGLQQDYFSLSKQTRDSAPTDSGLNDQLVKIKNFPSDLLRLKLVGVGKILTGIYILLLGILIALVAMPVRLGNIVKGKK